MADGQWHMVVDVCELRLGRVVKQDLHRVIENSTNDKIGILSHGGNGRGRPTPGQSDGVRQSLPGGVKMPQKAPNKANLESTQDLESHELK